MLIEYFTDYNNMVLRTAEKGWTLIEIANL